MPVPTSINDLSTTPASNSPAGTDTVTSSTGPDDYIRALSAILKTVSNDSGSAANVVAAAAVTPADADVMPVIVGGMLKKVTWANIKATLKTYFDTLYASLAGATFTGLVNFKTGANIASATTLNLSTATGNLVHITGTTSTTGVTMTSGQHMRCIADAAWPLTYHATTNRINGGVSYTCAAGDTVDYFYDGTTVIGNIIKKDGTAVVASGVSSVNGDTGAVPTFGYGQAWSAPTRVKDTLYTNPSSTMPLMVCIAVTVSGQSSFQVAGVTIAISNGAVSFPVYIVVPPSTTYKLVTASGSITVNSWYELS